jgi:F0F1-type ATP synthase assembly protein I
MIGGGPLKPGSQSAWRLATVGTELAGAVAGGTLLGYWIDWHFGTGPWGLVTGASVGIVGGLYNLVRRAVYESFQDRKDLGSQRHASDSDGKPVDSRSEDGEP